MKNVILLNNHSLHLYDFKELKKDCDLRISAVVFEDAYKTLSEDIKKNIDKIYVLPDIISSEQKFIHFPEDSLCSIIEEELVESKNTWIVASEELNVLTAAFLREKYNLFGPLSSIINNYTNKVKQKETLAKAGILTPKFSSVNRLIIKEKIEETYENLIQILGNPFILKPVDMGGTVGVEKIGTPLDFIQYLIEYKKFSYLIAEEFINGQLYHCDLIIQNGHHIFSEVSEYLWNGLSFLNGKNHGSLILEDTNPLKNKIIDFCIKANSCLGLEAGCVHFEVFVTKDRKIIFLEAAARPAGSMVPLVFTKTFLNNYLNSALLAEISEIPKRFNNPKEYYFWIFFPMKPGIIKSLNQPILKSHFNVKWFSYTGCLSHKPSSVSEKIGILLAKNKNYKILKNDFISFRNFNAIEIV